MQGTPQPVGVRTVGPFYAPISQANSQPGVGPDCAPITNNGHAPRDGPWVYFRPLISYNPNMTKFVEAIYTHGVLEPLEPLELPERQRVELTVRTLEGAVPTSAGESAPQMAPTQQEREAALDELFAEIDRMDLHLRVRMPTRDELHERG